MGRLNILLVAFATLFSMQTAAVDNCVSIVNKCKLSKLPDDNISHFPPGYRPPAGAGATEWDSRLLWLETKDGRKFGMFIMSSFLGVRTGFPLNIERRNDIAVVAITDEHGGKWELFTEGHLDKNFHFSSGRNNESWSMTRTETTADIQIETPQVDIDLHAIAQKPKSYYMNYGSKTPGWITINGRDYFEYVDQSSLEVKGTLRLGNETLEVTGSSWMERNWAEFRLIRGMANPFAWDFYFLQLDMAGQKNELIAFHIKDPFTGKVRFTYAAVTLDDGSLKVLDPSKIELFTVETSRYEGKKYGTRWILRFPEFHDLHVDLNLIPTDPWVGSSLSGFSWGHFDGPCRMNAHYFDGERRRGATGNAWAEQVNTTWAKPTWAWW